MSSKQRNEALDGLRVIAIAAVVIYHANQAWLPGGFFGVTVFFVLSGYLTTLSVARRLSSNEGFSYPRYLAERVGRLLPSMLLVVGSTLVLSLAFAPALLAKARADVVPSLLFFDNIHYVVNKVSYFAAAGLPSPLTHFWYLGLLMQFTVIWPLFIVATWKAGVSRKSVCVATAAMAVASTAAMAALFDPAGDTARVYYALDTRAAELLAGSLMAIATLGQGLSKAVTVLPGLKHDEGEAERLRKCERVAGPVALGGLVLMFFFANGRDAFAYRGGLLLASVSTAILVGTLCEPERGIMARVLGFRPLTALGRRSLSVYLWHYPLLLIMNPATRTTALPWWGWVLEFAVILAVSEASFRFVEQSRGEYLGLSKRKALIAVGALACTALLVAVPLGTPADSRPQGDQMTAEEKKEAADAAAAAREAAKSQTFDLSKTYFAKTEFAAAVDQINATNYTVDAETGATDAKVILIGDSVPDDASNEFYEIFPNGYMDAKIGRQLTTGPSAYRACQDSGRDGDIVVWSLADNGWVTEEQVKALIDCVDPTKKVYIVTCRCPDPWQDANNDTIRAAAEGHDNVSVIDWFAESAGHDEWFWNDGEHVRPEGAQAYVMMLRRAITGR